MDEKVFQEALVAYGCVGLWIVLSGAVITYNKFLLAVAGFPYPISLTLWYVTYSDSMYTIHFLVVFMTPLCRCLGSVFHMY